jgi:superfamily I DNA/RNA helicase
MRLPTRAELSAEQERVYIEAPMDGPSLIQGPPGTGKTVLLVYRAQNIIKSGGEFNLVMFNHVLRQYTARCFGEEQAKNIRTWDSWLCRWWQSAGFPRPFNQMPQFERWNYDFERALQFVDTCEKADALRWDCLLLDEGQDFPFEFYELLRVLVKEWKRKDGNPLPGMMVCADENQRLNPERHASVNQIALALGIPRGSIYRLTKNFRNTLPIAMFARQFHLGDIQDLPELPDAKGPKPELVKASDMDAEIIQILNYANNAEGASIGVCFDRHEVMGPFHRRLLQMKTDVGLNVQIYRGRGAEMDFGDAGGITFLCGKSIKGVEFDALFVPQLNTYRVDGAIEDFLKMNFYVISTRARSRLVFSFTAEAVPEVLRIFPDRNSGLIKYVGF